MQPIAQPLWQVAVPELLLLGGALLLLVLDLFVRNRHIIHGLSLALLLVVGLTTLVPLLQLSELMRLQEHVQGLVGMGQKLDPIALSTFELLRVKLVVASLDQMMVVDPLAALLKLCATLATALTLLYARPYLRDRGLWRGEVYSLTCFALLGQFLMISATNLLVIYVGLELLTLSLIALIALDRNNKVSVEAAMKYFVLGALASGFLLYGASMLYGLSGSLNITTILTTAFSVHRNGAMTLALVFVLAGLAFKIGAAPFHMWLPDVYTGARTAFTLLVAGAPKFAAFALFMRLLLSGLLGQAQEWSHMLQFLAVASLVIGNLAALKQSNFKRLLAYSTIAQVGFVLFAMGSVFTANGQAVPSFLANSYGSALFYLLSYVLTTLGTFGFILLLARQGFEAEEIDDFAGLYRRNPWAALLLTLMLLSLAGLPPLVGFWAKYMVLQSMIGSGLLTLAIFAVVMSLIAAYYYLRVIKVMFFDAPDTERVEQGRLASGFASYSGQLWLGLNGTALLLLGLFPESIMLWCLRVVSHMPLMRSIGL